MESGHREEGAREAVAGEGQPAPDRADELIQLSAFESEAEDDRRDLEDEELPAVIVGDRVGSEMAGDTTGEKDGRVDERDRPPVDIELRCRARWRRRPHDV